MAKQFGVLHESRRYVTRFSSISSSLDSQASRTGLESRESISTKISDLQTQVIEIFRFLPRHIFSRSIRREGMSEGDGWYG